MPRLPKAPGIQLPLPGITLTSDATATNHSTRLQDDLANCHTVPHGELGVVQQLEVDADLSTWFAAAE